MHMRVMRGHVLRHDARLGRLRRGAETVQVEEVGEGHVQRSPNDSLMVFVMGFVR